MVANHGASFDFQLLEDQKKTLYSDRYLGLSLAWRGVHHFLQVHGLHLAPPRRVLPPLVILKAPSWAPLSACLPQIDAQTTVHPCCSPSVHSALAPLATHWLASKAARRLLLRRGIPATRQPLTSGDLMTPLRWGAAPRVPQLGEQPLLHIFRVALVIINGLVRVYLGQAA
jgi:hypothetical protein